jgi:hypothetical protein
MERKEGLNRVFFKLKIFLISIMNWYLHNHSLQSSCRIVPCWITNFITQSILKIITQTKELDLTNLVEHLLENETPLIPTDTIGYMCSMPYLFGYLSFEITIIFD